MNFYEQVYAVARCIPAGKVTSYGRISKMLGKPNAARAVGYAMGALKGTSAHDVPWWRIINSQGKVSVRIQSDGANLQATRLREEGVELTEALKIASEDFWWEGLSFIELDDIISADRD